MRGRQLGARALPARARRKAECERAQPALLSAAYSDDDPTGVELLLKRKAKIDAHDALGRTALMMAALHGNTATAEALIDAGAQFGIADTRGTTALMEAARSGADGVIELIAARDPALDALDAMGRTALIIASQSRQSSETTIRLLLAAGAGRDVTTGDGKRAVDFAAAAGRWNIVALLDPDYPVPASVADAAVAGPVDLKTPPHLLDALRFDIGTLWRSSSRPFAPGRLPISRVCTSKLADHETTRAAHLADRIMVCSRRCSRTAVPGPLDALLARLPQTASAAAEWHAQGASLRDRIGVVRISAALASTFPRGHARDFRLAMIERGTEIFAAKRRRTHAAGARRRCRQRGNRADVARTRCRSERARSTRAHAVVGCAGPAVRQSRVPDPTADSIWREPRACGSEWRDPARPALARPELRRWLNWPQWKLPLRPLRGADLPAAAAFGDLEAVTKLARSRLADPVRGWARGGRLVARRRLWPRRARPDTARTRGQPGSRQHRAAQAPLSGRDRTPPRTASSPHRSSTVYRPTLRLQTGGTPLMIAAALGFPIIPACCRARRPPRVTNAAPARCMPRRNLRSAARNRERKALARVADRTWCGHQCHQREWQTRRCCCCWAGAFEPEIHG